jgi:hypothetical protein
LQCIFCVGSKETTAGLSAIGLQSGGSIGFVLGLPLTQTWGRIKEALPLMLTGLAVGYIALGYIVKKQKLPIYVIWALFLFFFAFYFFSNIPMWCLYLMPCLTFGSILVGYGFSKVKWRFAPIAFVVVPLIFMCLNLSSWDLGNTVDPNPSGAQRFEQQLAALPNGSIFYSDTLSEPWLVGYVYWASEYPNCNIRILNEGALRYQTNYYVDFKESQSINIPTCGNKSNLFVCYGNLSKGTPYYTTWNRGHFLHDLWIDNPGVPIYYISSESGSDFNDMTLTLSQYNGTEGVYSENESLNYSIPSFLGW